MWLKQSNFVLILLVVLLFFAHSALMSLQVSSVLHVYGLFIVDHMTFPLPSPFASTLSLTLKYVLLFILRSSYF